MLINEDCIRDVLRYCIEHIDYTIGADEKSKVLPVSLHELYECSELMNYEKKDIMYSVLKLIEVQFIRVENILPANYRSHINSCQICEVMYAGHKFYETTQPESIWKKTKSVISKVGVHSLGFIENVAHDIAVESAKEMTSIILKGNNL